MKTDRDFMSRALELARKNEGGREIAVGAVIVKDGEIIAEAANSREEGKSALLHAEMIAIASACEKLGDWRLSGCTIFVTLEPCPMCAGTILMSRLSRLVFGAYSPDGAVISRTRLFDEYDSKIKILGGLMAEECLQPLKRER